ncbi:hypothetical protein [uncultured Devosia sp.]|uniref:hypothetical protein n=1 Tax=uncultured Devosia sp. TaxID=211434 RepID=UPI0035CC3443
MPIRPLDVTVIFDATLRKPAPKMVVCIHPANGWFYRINSKGHWRPRVAVALAEHGFLDHDSFVECGDPLELDDYVVHEALERHGIVGTISASACPGIIAALDECITIRRRDREEIIALLTGI